MIKCVLFDRDGTLGELGDDRYPSTLAPFADVKRVLDELKAAGYTVGVVTNQSSIARGTGKSYDFAAEAARFGADAYEICPHDKHDGCDCRKPKSGLLLRAAAKLGVLPCECLMVGDRTADVECALNAGARAALVLTGHGKADLAAAKALCGNLIVLERFYDIVALLAKEKL